MNKELHTKALQAEQSLREAVTDMYRTKAKLGQYVVINRGGKPCRVPAEEALREAEAAAKRASDSSEANGSHKE